MHHYWSNAMGIGIAVVLSNLASPAQAQIRFHIGIGNVPPPLAGLPTPGGSNLPQQVCAPFNKYGNNRLKDLAPIDCIANEDITGMVFHVVGFSLSATRPQVQGFVAQVNGKLTLAQSGHRFSDAEIATLRDWSDEPHVEQMIGYPPMPANLLATNGYNAQWAIDAAFINKAIGYADVIVRNEQSLRNAEEVAVKANAAAEAEQKAQAAEASLEERAKAQCSGGIQDYQNMAMSSPFATKGHCYRLPLLVVSQWIDDKTAIANLAMAPLLIEFPKAPETQLMMRETIVKGEGAYQYQAVNGALRTIPRVRLVAQ